MNASIKSHEAVGIFFECETPLKCIQAVWLPFAFPSLPKQNYRVLVSFSSVLHYYPGTPVVPQTSATLSSACYAPSLCAVSRDTRH